ncbi:predicted protein [Nematostella vectensis]|uniref:Uncharacterized protein n=1 Tax=Nematostella vectensis TaxID=45351 RepID=A7RFX3_NEMVE|nr:predicted protein [Nematostella vectensis]|eukprot:XP_001641739.1 predicted protein [Nematostella vectensis]
MSSSILGIRGVVKNETANRTEQTRVYAVAVNATLWGDIILLNTCNLSVFKPGHMVNIWTAYDTAACGVALMVGVEYVITGYKSRMNRLSMDRCTSFIKRWDKTSPSERKTLGVCSAGSGVGLPSMLGLAFVVILLEWIY